MVSKFIEALGVKTHYVSGGSGTETLVFLHGWGGSTESFTRLSEDLPYKIILLDLPGFGQSGMPDSKGWDTHDYASWLEAFLKKLNIQKAHFYGHSFGCRVLVRLLLKRPELADKVILTGAAGIKWPLSFRQRVAKFMSAFKIKKMIPEKIQLCIKRKIFKAHDWADAHPEIKPTLQKVLAEEDFREELKKTQNNILLIWGAQDKITPIKSAHVYENNLQNATLTILPNGRHGIHHTHVQEVSGLIQNFLGLLS